MFSWRPTNSLFFFLLSPGILSVPFLCLVRLFGYKGPPPGRGIDAREAAFFFPSRCRLAATWVAIVVVVVVVVAPFFAFLLFLLFGSRCLVIRGEHVLENEVERGVEVEVEVFLFPSFGDGDAVVCGLISRWHRGRLYGVNHRHHRPTIESDLPISQSVKCANSRPIKHTKRHLQNLAFPIPRHNIQAPAET